MKPPVVILISVVLAVVASFVVIQLTSDNSKNTNNSKDEIAQLQQKLDELAKSQATLLQANRDLQSRLESSQDSNSRASQKEIQDAVANWMSAHAERGATKLATPEMASAPAVKKPTATLSDFNARLQQIFDHNLSYPETLQFWKELHEAGLTQQAVALFEKRAKDDPRNPDYQSDLGSAYLQVLQNIPSGPEKGEWAIKADRCFDSALVIDDHHWQARFSKATSLAFWPPIFGKQGEAAQNYETLISQQEATAPKPQFAQTYLFLGNIYQQQGKMDKAKEAWQKGLKVFPDNEELKKQISIADIK